MTGVQTCALPIYHPRQRDAAVRKRGIGAVAVRRRVPACGSAQQCFSAGERGDGDDPGAVPLPEMDLSKDALKALHTPVIYILGGTRDIAWVNGMNDFNRIVLTYKDGAVFELFKFRSMRHDAEKQGKAQWAAENDSRVTRVGRVIRKLRIDEIPQAINVLRGDMSLIGPRPERPEFVEQLKQAIPLYDLRHSVLPGISGWAQVNYPYGASIEDARRKLEYDLFYIVNSSLLLDVRIILRTIRVVIFRHGSR